MKLSGSLARLARSASRDWLWGVFVVFVIVALGRISDVGSFAGLPIKPWKPSAGFLFGILLARGPALLPWTILGSALSVVATTQLSGAAIDWLAPIGAALAANAGYGVAATYLRRHDRFDRHLASGQDILRLLAIGAAAAPVVAALEVVAFTAFGPLARSELPPAFARLCVGNLVGVGVIAPIILRLQQWRRSPLAVARRRAAVEVTATGVALFLLSWIIFGIESTDEFKVFDVLFIPVMALAVRYGLDGALAGLFMAQIAATTWLGWRSFPGETVVELQTLMLILAAAGLVVGIVVSERARTNEVLRRNEQRLREQDVQLAQHARLSSIGQMASILAHELNQPLTAVRAYTRAAARSISSLGESAGAASADLEKAISQVDLAATIIRRLREFLRRGERRRMSTSAERLVEETLALMEAAAAQCGASLRAEIAADLPSLFVDAVQIKQVLLNLLRNAVDASQGSDRQRTIVVGARLTQNGRAVEFSIRDNARGIAPEIRDRLFAAFATTKPEGLGLGLAISRTIVESHGGRIWLESTGADGTDFRFSIPEEVAG